MIEEEKWLEFESVVSTKGVMPIPVDIRLNAGINGLRALVKVKVQVEKRLE
jgi:hypothetical protein